jgi:signal transduction histidine kinase
MGQSASSSLHDRRAGARRRECGPRLLTSLAGCAVGLLLAFIAPVAAQSPAPETRRVLLLYSFGPHFSPWNRITGRFREELVKKSPHPIDLYEASLQDMRLDQPQDQQAFLDYLHALFTGRDPDLIVPVGAPAARFFQQYRAQIFPSAPSLIVGADARTFRADAFGGNDTAVAVRLNLPTIIENILQVLPDTTTIAMIVGDSPHEKFWVEQYRREFARFGNRVNFEWLNTLPFDDMMKRVVALPPHSAIFYGYVRVDANGVPQEADRVFARLHEVAKSPIFGFDDGLLGGGIVGGPLMRGQDLARRSAAVAVRILGGEPAGNIKTEPMTFGAPIYDWRQLRRWGIAERSLPAGSEIRFRQPGLWEGYRWEIVAALAVIALQSVMIGVLLYERRRRRTAEALARNSIAEMAHMNRLATAGELSASIAHEVNQPLTGIVAHANAGLRWLAAAPPNLDEVKTSLRLIVGAGHKAAEVIHHIRSFFKKGAADNAMLDVNDIVRDVLALVAAELRSRRVSVETGLQEPLPPIFGARVELQQIILNLVVNAAEAMEAVTDRRRTLRLSSETTGDGNVLVQVADSGPGIAPAVIDHVFKPFYTTKAKGMGMGLSIARSLAEAHHGSLSVSPGAHSGTVFRLVLPAAGPALRAGHSAAEGREDLPVGAA